MWVYIALKGADIQNVILTVLGSQKRDLDLGMLYGVMDLMLLFTDIHLLFRFILDMNCIFL